MSADLIVTEDELQILLNHLKSKIKVDYPPTNLQLFDAELDDNKYVENVVFTSGIVEDQENYILASGELDLYCRITYIPKEKFSI